MVSIYTYIYIYIYKNIYIYRERERERESSLANPKRRYIFVSKFRRFGAQPFADCPLLYTPPVHPYMLGVFFVARVLGLYFWVSV